MGVVSVVGVVSEEAEESLVFLVDFPNILFLRLFLLPGVGLALWGRLCSCTGGPRLSRMGGAGSTTSSLLFIRSFEGNVPSPVGVGGFGGVVIVSLLGTVPLLIAIFDCVDVVTVGVASLGVTSMGVATIGVTVGGVSLGVSIVGVVSFDGVPSGLADK